MRTIILIDGPHIYSLGKQLGFMIDFKAWREMFQKRSQLIRNYYFTAVRETEGSQTVRPLLDYLEYNGFTVVEKQAKEFVDDSTGRLRVKGDMRVDITVLALQLAQEKAMDEIVLVAGDDEFVPLIHALKAVGIIVTLVSTISECGARVADDLRRAADEFMDISDIREQIERKTLSLKK